MDDPGSLIEVQIRLEEVIVRLVDLYGPKDAGVIIKKAVNGAIKRVRRSNTKAADLLIDYIK